MTTYEEWLAGNDPIIGSGKGAFRASDLILSEERASELTSQLAEIVHLNIVNFKELAETTYDAAIGRAIASVGTDEPIKITFPRGSVKLNALITRKKNLTISAYGTKFVPTNNTAWMWTHYGDYFTVDGCEVEGEIVDTFRGFKVLNDATTKLSSYAFFKDVNLVDIYQALDFYCESGLGGASYRHKFSNVRIRNWTSPKTRIGSFGIRLGGNVEGDAAGNDTILHGVFVKGYEKNIILQKGVGTKLNQCSIDGGGIALELDGGSYLSISQCYIEYNDTFINALNNPYRPMILASTVANYTNYIVGTLYGNEELLNYSANSPIINKFKRNYNGNDYMLSRPFSGHGGGFWIDNDAKSYDFMKIGTKYGLLPSNDVDLYHNIETGYKHYFGRLLDAEFATIDSRGFAQVKQITPIAGIRTFTDGDITPPVDGSTVYQTANTVVVTITRFDYGIVGMRFTLIIKDANTTIAHNANIILKGKTNKTYAIDDTVEFVCYSAPTATSCVFYEL